METYLHGCSDLSRRNKRLSSRVGFIAYALDFSVTVGPIGLVSGTVFGVVVGFFCLELFLHHLNSRGLNGFAARGVCALVVQGDVVTAEFLAIFELLFSLVRIYTERVILSGAIGRGSETRAGRDFMISPYLDYK